MKLLRTVQFHQSYFGGMAPRLRLDSISIVSATATEKMVYRFAYETSDVVPLNSKSKDYWGYYNGRSNPTLIPGVSTWFPYGAPITLGNDPNSRKPDPSFVQMGMLRRIQFPTGGIPCLTMSRINMQTVLLSPNWVAVSASNLSTVFHRKESAID